MSESNSLALQASGLRKVYGNGVEALKDVSLDVVEGDFFALLGPNGAGKSTLIGIVSSLVNLGDGEVRVFGNDLRTQRAAVKASIGLVPQEFNFNQFEKPIDIVINQAGFYGVPRRIATDRAEKYLNALNLWDKRDAVSRTLSGGMKRRLMIARAMVHEPRMLILDEPTAGVDIEIRRSMWTYLRDLNQAGTTVILTTHYLEEAESLCRNVAIIDHGRIIEKSTTKELLAKLDREIFVLDLVEPLQQQPSIPGYEVSRIDDTTLEVDLPRGTALNRLFAGLDQAGIQISSMRNKSNRLEELFVRLTGKAA